MEKKLLITSALPYVNNVPHLGNIIGCVLPGDVYSRYSKMMGRDALYICGADEYGTCTEVKAREEGVTPRKICDKYIEIHKQIYDWFQIGFDYWGRTSAADPRNDSEWNHTQISQEIFRQLAENDYLIEQEMDQLYCNELETFVSDRFVQGTCPKCGYEKAKGDQCDGCGELLNAVDIINPVYKLNNDFSLEIRQTTHLFLDLPKLEPRLREWFERAKVHWDKNTIGITQAWLDKGLQPRCITRDLKWGTPVPNTEKYGDKFRGKVMYNWFDAPIGYPSITSNFTKDWKDWWMNPDGVEYAQFYGTDNVAFHTIIFPASLLGTNDSWTLVNRISAVNYLTYQGGKFSKSENVGVFGDGAIDSGIPSDIWRYYLLLQRPEGKTTEFSWYDLQAKVNGELNDNIGNLANRILSFTHKRFNKQIPELKGELTEEDQSFIKEFNETVQEYHNLMTNIKLKDGLYSVLKLGHLANKYMVVVAPWKVWKVDQDRCGDILHILCHVLGIISNLLSPFMPTTSERINEMLGFRYDPQTLQTGVYQGSELQKPTILFSKIDDDAIASLQERFG